MDGKETLVWVVGIVAAAAVLIAPAACTMERHKRIAEAIQAGGEPLAVKCAIGGDEYSSVCAILAAKAAEGGNK